MEKTPKSQLKELLDSLNTVGASLKVLDITDPTKGAGLFEFSCEFIKCHGGTVFTGRGTGGSKKLAEHSACQVVLDLMKQENGQVNGRNVSDLNAMMPGISINPNPALPQDRWSRFWCCCSSSTTKAALINGGNTSPDKYELKQSDESNDTVLSVNGSQLDTKEMLESATGAGNIIGQLQEFCVKKKLENPVYSEEQWRGPDNSMRHKITCSVENFQGFGVALVKVNAKKIAAFKVLQTIELDGKYGNTATISNVPKPEPKAQSSSKPTPMVEVAKVPTMVTQKIAYFPNIQIGEGAQVYEGYFETPTRKAAVKISTKEAVHHEKNKELDIMRKVNHPNVVTYFTTEDIGPLTYIVMELADRTLNDVIKLDKNIEPPLLKKFCTDITTGLTALHKLNIVHRDLNPSNVLIFGDVAKLADFGISKELDSFPQGVVTEAGKGTLIWMPPEGLRAIGSPIPFRLVPSFDIFSLGLTIHYAMTRGSHPFDFTGSDHLVQIQSNIFKSKPNWSWISANEFTALKNLLKSMISTDTSKRPNSSYLMEHPFFWDDKKSMEFVYSVTNDLKKKSPETSECQTKISQIFVTYLNQHPSLNKSWKSRLCVELQRFIDHKEKLRSEKKGKGISPNLKSYKETSMMKLIEFIRDHNQHYED